MPKTIKIATVQMDANPAPVKERLNRAEKVVGEAVQAGAQLVVLPELFNTGYAYTDANFSLAEIIDGITSTWLKTTASRLNIHLAGSFLLLDDGEIYNAMLLYSPSGQVWRYDKNYPWAWERGYFRERRGITIAHTELGDLGMLICWDVGHLNMWKQYAGQIDMLVVASCPPDGPNATFQFADGSRINSNDLGSAMDSIKDTGKQTFGEMVNQQAKWLGIPVVNSGASGHVLTHIPKADSLLKSLLLLAPHLIKQLGKAKQMQMSCDMIPSCKVVNAKGEVISARSPSEGEGYTLASVELQNKKPMPNERQPKSPLNPIAYLNADITVPFLMKSVYRKGIKQVNNRRYR